MNWSVLELELERDTAAVRFSNGLIEIEVYCDVRELGLRRAVLVGVHVQGPGPNQVGPKIRSLAKWVKALLDVDELRIEGATRTSGAGPGRDPAPIVFR